jgi:uncharacterized alkaline shock family protein YloU
MASQEDIGTIQINPDVIATIALMAAKEVEGIVIHDTATHDLALHDILNRKKREIKVTTDDANNYAVIDIKVDVEYGADVYKAAHNLQRAIRNAVEGMTGKPVRKVNIVIEGIVAKHRAGPPETRDSKAESRAE